MTETTYDTTGDGEREPRLTTSQRHRVLANERRRIVCDLLAGHTEPVDLQTVTEAVRVREGADDGPNGDAIRIALHHSHLPLLDDVGLVDYDPASHRIVPHPASLDRL